MEILLIAICTACLILSWLYLRLCGDIRSLLGQLEEIDRGSHMELAVNSRQKCLLALCRSLNRVLSARDAEHIRYQKAERQLKQNITNLAHDIRTPLTGASGYVQLAQECGEPEKRAHYLQVSENRLAELEDMLEKLFLYAKLTSEDYVLSGEDMRKIQVLPVLGDCLLSFHKKFEEAGFSPEVLFESEDFCVFAEEEALRRVFLNLIQNAFVHGAGGITIRQKILPGERVEVVSQGGKACAEDSLVFENPVPPDSDIDTAQIFERFYKADAARRKSSSGLGLFIVKELMQKMGGEVRAEMDGALFRIELCFAPHS